MKSIQFTKMEGVGNDYVYVNTFEETISNPEELAIQVSHRHYGIGSDGLVLIGPSDKANVRMTMFNLDGSKSEMCGNAIRCVGKYALEHGLVDNKIITVETDAGVKTLQLDTNGTEKVEQVSVEMGIPMLEPAKIPSTLTGTAPIINQAFDFGAFKLNGTLVSMGNPHFISFVENVASAPLEKWGPVVEHHVQFPNRINFEVVEIVSKTEIKQRTWERGCGETWACGTGASAVCVACVLNNKTETTILNHLKGGDLTLTWEGIGHEVIMVGPAREVFTGTWPLNH